MSLDCLTAHSGNEKCVFANAQKKKRKATSKIVGLMVFLSFEKHAHLIIASQSCAKIISQCLLPRPHGMSASCGIF